MLLKLLKHDYKNAFKNYSLFFIIMLVSAVFVPFLMNLNIDWLNIIIAPLLFFLIIGSSIMLVVNTVLFIQRTMFSDAAYLNYTLPVKMSMTLLSKIIVSLSFVIVTMIVSIVSFILFFYIFATIESVDFSILIYNLRNIQIDWLAILVFTVLLLVAASVGLLTLILSMTIANTSFFKKNSPIYIILLFLLITFTLTIIENGFTSIMGLTLIETDLSTNLVFQGIHHLDVVVLIVYDLIIAVILFFITNSLLNRKLEM